MSATPIGIHPTNPPTTQDNASSRNTSGSTDCLDGCCRGSSGNCTITELAIVALFTSIFFAAAHSVDAAVRANQFHRAITNPRDPAHQDRDKINALKRDDWLVHAIALAILAVGLGILLGSLAGYSHAVAQHQLSPTWVTQSVIAGSCVSSGGLAIAFGNVFYTIYKRQPAIDQATQRIEKSSITPHLPLPSPRTTESDTRVL